MDRMSDSCAAWGDPYLRGVVQTALDAGEVVEFSEQWHYLRGFRVQTIVFEGGRACQTWDDGSGTIWGDYVDGVLTRSDGTRIERNGRPLRHRCATVFAKSAKTVRKVSPHSK